MIIKDFNVAANIIRAQAGFKSNWQTVVELSGILTSLMLAVIEDAITKHQRSCL